MGWFYEPLKSLENSGGAHATADAHCHHAVSSPSALHFTQDACGKLRARASQRVTKRNRAAVHVQTLEVQIQFLDYRQAWTANASLSSISPISSSFNPASLSAFGLLLPARCPFPREEHRPWQTDKPGHRLETKTFGAFSRHDQRRRCAIRHL